jgi:DNA-binding CsgD family transcriptional regulator
LLLAEGDPTATVTLREAVEAWHALGVPYEEATARTLLGQAERLAGDDAGAAASFGAAVAQFDQIGARLESRLVRDDTKRELPEGLTEREVEVLRLIAAGLTNNEIAAELFLSVKTVSRHLSNIFTKIGVSTRAAATAFAFEHDLVRPRASARGRTGFDDETSSTLSPGQALPVVGASSSSRPGRRRRRHRPGRCRRSC